MRVAVVRCVVTEDTLFAGLSDGCTGPIDDGATIVRGWSEAAEPEGLHVGCANDVSSMTNASSNRYPRTSHIGHRTQGVEGKARSQGLEVLLTTYNKRPTAQD